MTIKHEAFQKFFQNHAEQVSLANALDEMFDVTFGGQHGEQYLWLCAPKPGATERFGLEKEVVALYSPHRLTDARVLTNLENISRAPDFRHRIDKVVAILIHEGDTAATEQLISSQTDWVIVPLTREELTNPSRGNMFLRSRFSDRIGTFDLFGMSSPIKHDKYFYGRDPLVQELMQRATLRKENSGLFGLRKTGKTSVLFALQRRLVDKSVVVEYVDCQSPGIYGSRWWQLLQELSYRMRSTLEIKTGKKLRDDGTYTQESAANSFSHVVKNALKTTEVEEIVLLFDEIEFITPGISNSLGAHWDQDFLPFWQTIRSASQETNNRLLFIVAGVNPSSVEKSHFDQIQNPIFQLAVPFYLEPLSQSSVREMVRSIGRYSGIAFQEDCYKLLRDVYGGHPYLMRLACSEVVRAISVIPIDKKTSIGISNFKEKESGIKARLAQPIKDILLSLVWWYPDEYDLLQMLAAGDKDFVAEFLKDSPEKGVQFVRYGLVSDDKGTFTIRDLQDFLREFGNQYKEVISPFKRGDLPPEVFPQVANLEDLSQLFEKRTEIETALRKLILMFFGFKCGFNDGAVSDMIIKSLARRQGRADPSQLFIGRRPQEAINELFLSDLKPIFRHNWPDFSPTFDKKQDRFEMNLDTINIARRYEAHTKPVDPVDKENFLNSYSWLRSHLARVPNLL